MSPTRKGIRVATMRKSWLGWPSKREVPSTAKCQLHDVGHAELKFTCIDGGNVLVRTRHGLGPQLQFTRGRNNIGDGGRHLTCSATSGGADSGGLSWVRTRKLNRWP